MRHSYFYFDAYPLFPTLYESSQLALTIFYLLFYYRNKRCVAHP